MIVPTYNIYLDDVLWAENYPETSFEFTELMPDTEYTVKIVSVCGTLQAAPVTLKIFTLPEVCNEPTNLVVSAITATSATLTWVPGALVDSQELIINNGEPIALSSATTTYPITGMPSGSTVAIRIRSICGSVTTPGITTVINLVGCGAVTNLGLAITDCLLQANWDAVANAAHYLVSITKDADPPEIYTVTNNTTSKGNLVKGSTYVVVVNAVCMVGGTLVNGPTDTDNITNTLDCAGNCSRYLISNAVYVDATTVGFTISEINGNNYGNPIRLVIYADGFTVTPIDTKIVYTPGYYELTNLVASTAYDIYAYSIVADAPVLANPLLDECTLNTPYNYTHATCWVVEPADFNLVWSNPNTLIVDFTAPAWTGAQTTFDLYYQYYGDTEWTLVAEVDIALDLPYSIIDLVRKRTRIKIIVDCGGTDMLEVISDWICPDTPQITFTLNGDSVFIFETLGIANEFVDNSMTYKVTVASLVYGTQSYERTRDNLSVSDLIPNTTYTITVERMCIQAAGTTLGTPRVFTFMTSSTTPCAMPSALAVEVESTCTGTPPPGQCALFGEDWEVLSSFFVYDPTNQNINEYYLEANIHFWNQDADSGTEIILPGGIAAIIVALGCRPLISVNMDVTPIIGFLSVITIAAVLTNDGNLNITGSFVTNGLGQFAVTVRATYLVA